jgi:hypothetical protein
VAGSGKDGGNVGGKFGGNAVSLLLNLGAARQGRSMLFPDEQKLLFEGGEKGFAKNTKLDFFSCYLNLE